MPPFFVKYYNLSKNTTAQIRSKSVISINDIISFITSVADEDNSIWSSLESSRIEKSLKRMGINDWLKIAINFDQENRNFDNAIKRFIIITKRPNEPCVLPGQEYNIFKMSGTHFSNQCFWILWSCLITTPWVLATDAVCSCCFIINTTNLLTKQYVTQYKRESKV